MQNYFVNFLLNKGLYQKVEINNENIEDLIELIKGDMKVDVYCTECKKERTFISAGIINWWEDDQGKHSSNLGDVLKKKQEFFALKNTPVPGGIIKEEKTGEQWSNPLKGELSRVLVFKFTCRSDSCHHLDYVVVVNNNEVKKIGQNPSIADLSFPELKSYEKVCSKEDLKELKRAIGLSAQGIGVGAYVYLRRIIERMIQTAKVEAIQNKIITEEEYKTERTIQERIKLLKDYLPKILLENTEIYRIVSKGIHELSEEDCINYFPVLKECILFILREYEVERKRAEQYKNINSAISRISTHLDD